MEHPDEWNRAVRENTIYYGTYAAPLRRQFAVEYPLYLLVAYGNGNILGYRRENGTYVIEPEQAYTVRKIFELYVSGLGYKKICAELIRLGCKNAHGKVSWKTDRIGRILQNATYKGYICYNKSHSDGYLTQKRINHKEEAFQYIKGNFEAIVPEELWDQCAEIRSRKSAAQMDP